MIQLGRNGKTYELYKRVPRVYVDAGVTKQKHVRKSLKTDSPTLAQAKAVAVWAELIAGWEAALDGKSDDALKHYNHAKIVAARLGLEAKSAEEVAKEPFEDIRKRVQEAQREPHNAEALLDARRPAFKLSGLAEAFFKAAEREATANKTPDQKRKWRNPWVLAQKNVIKALGDIDLAQISRKKMKELKDWYLDKVYDEEVKFSQNSANKNYDKTKKMLREVNDHLELDLNFDMVGLRIKTVKGEQRPSIPDEMIEAMIAPGALDKMNEEARQILLMSINTGCRHGELASMKVGHLHLSGNIPFLQIKPEDREIKNDNSIRDLPLVGVSLEAAREALARANEQGLGPKDWLFPRYAGKDAFSAAANKFLRDNKILSEDYTVYGLRHSLEQRMISIVDGDAIPERVSRDIMGHGLTRSKYGQTRIEVKEAALNRIAYR